MTYLNRDGVRLNYQTFGPPDGATPLLLTHGFSASSAMWQPNIAALAAARPVIAWDLRGHGSSDAPDDQPDLFSQQVLAFLDQPDLRTPGLEARSL